MNIQNRDKSQNKMDAYPIIFRERLREIRLERNYTQKQLADKLGLATSTFANWEQGRTEPNIAELFNIIIVLEIEANELFDISGIKF